MKTQNSFPAELVSQQLTENKALLQSVFDTSLIGMSVLNAVRDESGLIVDFRIKMVSKELERLTGRTDLVGNLYSEEYPGIKQTHLFTLMLEVMETGMAQQTDYKYELDGYNNWFSSMFVKAGDDLVATNLDITQRKLLEQEQFKILSLLEKTEDIAGTGSWAYNRLSKSFTWSKGMYTLFGLPMEADPNQLNFLKHASSDAKSIARRINRYILSGQKNFEEILPVQIKGEERILKIKASLVNEQDKNSLRVIGVNMDITDQVRLQQEKEALMVQEKVSERKQIDRIFQESLNAQEDDRKRISESLHNGIGQLLYAVKMTLNMVDLDKNPDLASLYQFKKATEQLLVEAIQESRRVSHELTPIMLADFGLVPALEDLCKQFNSTITLQCNFNGLISRMDQFLELSIYRMIQELVSNIIKHGKATKVSLVLEQQQQQIIITIYDNGLGLKAADEKHTGGGLEVTANKVKLLNGSFSHKSGEGTLIKISIPY